MKKRFVGGVVMMVFLGVILFPLVKSEANQVYYPGRTTFGVQNAIFGSRLNLNHHYDWSRRKVWTSTRGTMMDYMTSFIVATRLDSDGSVMRFAPSDQNYPEYWYYVYDMNANTFEENGAHVRNGARPGVTSDIVLSVNSKTISHFVPTTSFEDSNLKIAIAPFFYKEITVTNYTDSWQSGELLVSVDYAVNYRQIGNTKIIYYKTSADKSGIRALAIKDLSASWGIGTRIFDDFASSGRLINSSQPDGTYNAGGFAVSFNLAPRQSTKKLFVYAGYDGGKVMIDKRTGRGLKFYYTKFFGNVEEVIDYAFSNYGEIVQKANTFSNTINTGSEDIDFSTSQGIHSYIANTWLLYDPTDNIPRYYVSEGQCQFLSTVDVAYDIAFFETSFIPWALKIQLEEWSQYVSSDAYGAIIEHDMGWRNEVRPSQAYPHSMGVEENTNYILMLFLYWKKTGDSDFVKGKIPLIQKLISSLQRRDTNGNGIVDIGAYNTTVDFDFGVSAIGDATENIYIGIKELVSFLAAGWMYDSTSIGGKEDCRQWAEKIAQTLKDAYKRLGYLPVSLSSQKPGWGDQTIINFEGLLYLFLTGTEDPLIDDLLATVSPSHLSALINCNRRYGYNLSSSGNDSWLSKVSNAAIVNYYFIIKGYYAYDDEIIVKTKNLLERSDLGYADGWNVENGLMTTSALSLYPRGASLATYPLMLSSFVKKGYWQWLHRDPDAGGYNAYLNDLKNGSLTINRFVEILRHSQEYAEYAPFCIGSKRCAGYVDFAFQHHFGYPQDQAGRQHFISLLTSWQWDDGRVWWEFYYASIVWQMYRELLFRDPDPGGYQSNMNALYGGHSRQELEANIRASDEYKQKHPNG